MKGKHYILSFVGLAAIAAMYFLLPKTESKKQVIEQMPSMASAFDIVSHINDAKAEMNEAQLSKISEWETKAADTTKRKVAFLNLAEIWASSKHATIAAYYSAQLAGLLHTDSTWVAAGDDAMLALKHAQIPIEKQYNAQQAEMLYNKAMAMNPNNLQTKIKLASSYVESGNSPMKGIQMLLAEAEKDPNNAQINLALGQFSIMSGQLDKAIARFDKVLSADKTNVEAMYLKAETLRMMGKKQEAIRLLEDCLSIVKIPELKQEIEAYISKIKSE